MSAEGIWLEWHLPLGELRKVVADDTRPRSIVALCVFREMSGAPNWVRALIPGKESAYPEYLVLPHIFWLDAAGQRRLTLAYCYGRSEVSPL